MMIKSNLDYNLVDFHCHLDLFPNHVELIRECEDNNIKTLTMTNAPSVWFRNNELTKNTKHVRAALGLHPQLALQREGELNLFEGYLPLTRYIGEVGLDGSQEFENTIHIQKRVFEKILSLAANFCDKIVSIHSRRAATEVIDLLEFTDFCSAGKVVFHWFTGNLKEARRALDLGAYFSVNHRTLNSKNGLALLNYLPRNRILTESDAPFIEFHGRPIRPNDIVSTIDKLAAFYSTSPPIMRKEILGNLQTLLRTN